MNSSELFHAKTAEELHKKTSEFLKKESIEFVSMCVWFQESPNYHNAIIIYNELHESENSKEAEKSIKESA